MPNSNRRNDEEWFSLQRDRKLPLISIETTTHSYHFNSIYFTSSYPYLKLSYRQQFKFCQGYRSSRTLKKKKKKKKEKKSSLQSQNASNVKLKFKPREMGRERMRQQEKRKWQRKKSPKFGHLAYTSIKTQPKDKNNEKLKQIEK